MSKKTPKAKPVTIGVSPEAYEVLGRMVARPKLPSIRAVVDKLTRVNDFAPKNPDARRNSKG